MNSYIEIIKIAVIIFPFIAILLSAPFIIMQYHKYGALSFYKALIIYSFVLYFMCAYFLVILPLPKISQVALLTTPKVQLIPLKFIADFVRHTSFDITNISTYLKAIKQMYFYMPLFNIVLTMPFGVYLRYYFKCNFKKVVIYSFLLSLFFELTQLSGLYFIYPRGYRLFDVDDLILNTIGGILGYLIFKKVVEVLPKIDDVEKKAKERGKTISGFRRTTTFCLDIFILLIIELFISVIVQKYYFFWYIFALFIYYGIFPIILKGSTIGERFLNIKIVDNNNKFNVFKYYSRIILFIIIYFAIPYLVYYILIHLNIINEIKEVMIFLSTIGMVLLLYAFTCIKYLFTNKQMLYEKLSKTKMISTIKTK